MPPTKGKKKTTAKLNEKVSDFTVPSSAQKDFVLSEHKGQKIVLYFYPKDNTPGCTIEGQDFNKALVKFKKLNTLVLGVSKDSLGSHEKFIDKCGFKFDLLSDVDGELCEMFDVIKDKNMYGKKFKGIERSTFILDENLKLVGEFRKVKVAGHVDEVLEFIKNL